MFVCVVFIFGSVLRLADVNTMFHIYYETIKTISKDQKTSYRQNIAL